MGQKIHPHGFRVGVTEGWNSRWFAPKKLFGELLIEDQIEIRKLVDEAESSTAVRRRACGNRADAGRTSKVLLHTARPGVVIGPKGAEVDKLRNELEDLTSRKVKVEIAEIGSSRPEPPSLVAEGIAEQLNECASFRRVLKQKADASQQRRCEGHQDSAWPNRRCRNRPRREDDQRLDSAAHAAGAEHQLRPGSLQDAVWNHRHQGVDLASGRTPRPMRRLAAAASGAGQRRAASSVIDCDFGG